MSRPRRPQHRSAPTGANEAALARHQTPLLGRRSGAAARHGARRAQPRAPRRREVLEVLHEKPFVGALGCVTGNQAMQQVQAGLEAIYLLRLAGCRRRQYRRAKCIPDQSLYPVDSVPKMVERINNALLRADQIHHARWRRQHRLARADRRGCGGRLRRRAQRVRADEGDDPGRRGRRALRGPALLREEVRAHGRQGAGSHRRGHQQAGGGAARRGRCGVPTCSSRARMRRRPIC